MRQTLLIVAVSATVSFIVSFGYMQYKLWKFELAMKAGSEVSHAILDEKCKNEPDLMRCKLLNRMK